MKKTHAYYYQIQAQIKFCNVTYCDFVVWQENELVVQRIFLDEEFISTALEKATLFFKFGVLPENLGKWYSKEPVYLTADVARICDTPHSSHPPGNMDKKSGVSVEIEEESGEIIQCESGKCPISWFHTSCLKISQIPKGNGCVLSAQRHE